MRRIYEKAEGVKMLSFLRQYIEKLNLALGYLSGLGILLMGLILFYEVVARYCFNSPTIWTQEVSIYIFIWTMLAGAAYTLQIGKHVRIDLILIHLSPRTQIFLEIITSVLGMFFSAYVATQGWDMVQASLKYQKLSATPLRVPIWIPQLAIFIGFSLLALEFFILVCAKISEVRNAYAKDGEKTC
ncbi:Tripartite ATP-independent periplasmic transporter DctQ component [Thermovirga lienii DSM 17291]|uniref:Tripartite ATP-independent periplasmic transporter DctQ component n=1 Tax=Thermovirga lienii (strain ATCC BAA-1197 / DSM 17291 / Cas60314) TaxID=580340 RepID=G7V6D5_THELD|nr:TRAP transporter small permease [Thermovirga lienii]AER65964.1 Tripartite ATP-independent periplasmic transporter DctQ component [Thermovirga lienii DSM 17291]